MHPATARRECMLLAGRPRREVGAETISQGTHGLRIGRVEVAKKAAQLRHAHMQMRAESGSFVGLIKSYTTP